MANKNMIIALVLSFIWSGLGLIYAEDMQKGIILAVVAVICYILMYFVSPIFGMVVFIVWIYSIYATYKQVKVVNGEWDDIYVWKISFLINYSKPWKIIQKNNFNLYIWWLTKTYPENVEMQQNPQL